MISSLHHNQWNSCRVANEANRKVFPMSSPQLPKQNLSPRTAQPAPKRHHASPSASLNPDTWVQPISLENPDDYFTHTNPTTNGKDEPEFSFAAWEKVLPESQKELGFCDTEPSKNHQQPTSSSAGAASSASSTAASAILQKQDFWATWTEKQKAYAIFMLCTSQPNRTVEKAIEIIKNGFKEFKEPRAESQPVHNSNSSSSSSAAQQHAVPTYIEPTPVGANGTLLVKGNTQLRQVFEIQRLCTALPGLPPTIADNIVAEYIHNGGQLKDRVLRQPANVAPQPAPNHSSSASSSASAPDRDRH
jgi:hypothetical protein